MYKWLTVVILFTALNAHATPDNSKILQALQSDIATLNDHDSSDLRDMGVKQLKDEVRKSWIPFDTADLQIFLVERQQQLIDKQAMLIRLLSQ